MNISTQLQSLTDTDLIEKSISSDRDAYAALVSRYQTLVCSLAYGIVGDVALSEDLAQDAFVAAWKKLDTLRERSRFKSWLCGITRNLSLKAVRKRQSESSLKKSLITESSLNSEPEDKIVTREEQQILWSAIEDIPEKYRQPLILFYREEQSVACVAESLDLSEDAVKQRLSRGRVLLRAKVLSLLEDVLARTKPGPIFTAAVIGVLPGLLATSAAAASAGSAGAVGKTALGSTAVSGGALAGALGGAGGALLGYFVGHQTARYSSQRKVLRMGFIGVLVIVTLFLLPWITQSFNLWSASDLSQPVYLVLYFLWFAGFFGALAGWSSWFGRKSRQVAQVDREAGNAELRATPLRRWLQKWEGRRWNSKVTCFGLPLVSIAFSDPDRDFSGLGNGENDGKQIAKGWIAVGDRAIGLLAFGNLAFGGIAIGSVSVGVVAVGGIAAGGVAVGGVTIAILAFAGFAFGVGAIGGLAVGAWSYGGAAFGWKAASGGFAAANEFAIGGAAYAQQANNDVAKSYIESHFFFEIGQAYSNFLQNPWGVPTVFVVMFSIAAFMLLIGFRKKILGPTKVGGGGNSR